jgi:hypothetical protein
MKRGSASSVEPISSKGGKTALTTPAVSAVIEPQSRNAITQIRPTAIAPRQASRTLPHAQRVLADPVPTTRYTVASATEKPGGWMAVAPPW